MVAVELDIGLYVAIQLALLGAALLYRDAGQRGMDAADMWAVGFFVAFFLLPVLGGLVVVAFYLRNRTGRRGRPDPVFER